MKIFICEFLQESNAFNPIPATEDAFSSSGIFQGDALVQSDGAAGETIDGMLREMARRNCVAVGGVRMRAGSGGPVAQYVVDTFMRQNSTLLQAALPVDGVLVSLHGATVTPESDDVCGDILSAIRQIVGEKTIIAATCDLHGNITTPMLDNADLICGYQTYPHLDHRQVGQRAASLLCDRLEGRLLHTCCVRLPMMAPAHAYSTGSGGLNSLMEHGYGMVEGQILADFSVFQVQPWLDVSEICSAVITIAENRDSALTAALDLAEKQFALRKELQGQPLWQVNDVIEKALSNKSDAPIILVDSADSSNAGACGDCAAVLADLLPYRDRLRAAVTVNDPDAVEQAFSLGIGSQADFVLGGCLAPLLSKPIAVSNATVKSLHNGDFILGGPAERGQPRCLGRCAVLSVGQIQVLLTSRSQNAGDLQYYRGFGIEPTLCDLVCVKACTSLRAGYAPIASQICNTQTPGAAGPVLQNMPYTKLPTPFYPFSEISQKNILPPVFCRETHS